MKKNVNSLALRIAQIQEEHSPEEIADAIALLNRYGTISELLNFLATSVSNERKKKIRKQSTSTPKTKSIEQVTSNAVRKLENSDPIKYQILLEFDKVVRSGKVLQTNEALRRFGERLSKEFRSRNNRKDNISTLMTLLSQMPESDLNYWLKQVYENSPAQQSNEYQKLATFLIRGKDTSTK